MSVAEARPYPHEVSKSTHWEKFLRKVSQRKGSGALHENDIKKLEGHFSAEEIERVFTDTGANAEEPILIVRALNLLAGPGESVGDVFGEKGSSTQKEESQKPDQVVEKNKAHRNSSKQASNIGNEGPLIEENELPHANTQKVTKNEEKPDPMPSAVRDRKRTTNSVTPKPTPVMLPQAELNKLTQQEFVAFAIKQADAHGLLDNQGSAWPHFIKELTTVNFYNEDHYSLKSALRVIGTAAGWRGDALEPENVADHIFHVIEARDLPTFTTLLSRLAVMTARQEITLPPTIKENGEPWSLESYGILSPTKLSWFLRAFPTWGQLAVATVQVPLSGNAGAGYDDILNIEAKLDRAFKKTPDQVGDGDHTRVIYSHIPPKKLLIDTLAATKPAGNLSAASAKDTTPVRVHDVIKGFLDNGYVITTQAAFTNHVVRAIESSLLGVGFIPSSASPWFHLELMSQGLELWTHLRDGNPKAAGIAIDEMARYLDTNPLTRAMIATTATASGSLKTKIEAWNGKDAAIAIHDRYSSIEVNGVWLRSENGAPLDLTQVARSTQPDPDPNKSKPIVPVAPPQSAVDDDKAHYLFLTPGEYEQRTTKQQLRVISE